MNILNPVTCTRKENVKRGLTRVKRKQNPKASSKDGKKNKEQMEQIEKKETARWHIQNKPYE